MNTIRTPRSRPRVSSMNFRSLWWAIHRLACWQVIYYGPPTTYSRLTVEPFMLATMARITKAAERHLNLNPRRRYHP